jgi:hypothetical protein
LQIGGFLALRTAKTAPPKLRDFGPAERKKRGCGAGSLLGKRTWRKQFNKLLGLLLLCFQGMANQEVTGGEHVAYR